MGKKVRCTFVSGQRKLCKCEKGRTGSNYGGLGTIHGGVRTLLVFAIRLAPILGISKTVYIFFLSNFVYVVSSRVAIEVFEEWNIIET